MQPIFIGTAIVLMISVFVCLYRAIVGPAPADRVISINVIGTKTVAIIALMSFALNEEFFLDVAMVYALISFIMTIGVAKYLEYNDID